jgi:mannose-6-phosphate isomerase-like protein (cupin superfamily)
MTIDANSCFIREKEVPAYQPKGHSGTVNRRLVGRENVGAEKLEVVLGTVQPGEGASPHLHPDIEQVCYLLSGAALVSIADVEREIGPGDTVFFPAGVEHALRVVGNEPVRLLVVYSPPYAEGPRIDR